MIQLTELDQMPQNLNAIEHLKGNYLRAANHLRHKKVAFISLWEKNVT
jgi:hypothetical protein